MLDIIINVARQAFVALIICFAFGRARRFRNLPELFVHFAFYYAAVGTLVALIRR